MAWVVEYYEEFVLEFAVLSSTVQTELLAHAKLLEASGPSFGRPWVDTLHGSRHSNMKELRFTADQGVWRNEQVITRNRTDTASSLASCRRCTIPGTGC